MRCFSLRKTLITGVAGFLGSHLAKQLIDEGYNVIGIDNLSSGKIENIKDLPKENNAKIVYTSTSETYGNPEVHPQPEYYRGNVNTWGPRACYDESKKDLVRCTAIFIHSLFHVKVKVARTFNTYSAGLANDDGR